MLKVAILGYGGIARSHRRGYELLASKGAPVELVALCDIDPNKFNDVVSTNLESEASGDIRGYRTYTDLEEMLEKERLDTIDVCLPSYLHCEYTVMLLKRGYNVQCEKPMGLNEEQCRLMLDAAKESGKKLMIGMCLRFENDYLELKRMIDEGTYGKVESAHFERRSAFPRWSTDSWYHNYELAGGVALDLHIHDVDMIRFLFGDPKAVSALTTDCKMRCTTIASRFHYDDKLVTAIADWGESQSCKFNATYRLNFERATVVYDGEKIFVYPDEGEPFELQYEKNKRIAAEEGYFAGVVAGGKEQADKAPEDAARTVATVAKLMESAENGGAVLEV